MAYPATSARSKNWGTEILTDADLEAQLDLLHAWLNDAFNSSTGHKHDGTTSEGPKIATGGLADGFINGLSTVTGLSTDYIAIADASDTGNAKKALASDFVFVPTAANALAGSVVQVVNTQSGAVATGSTIMPVDDTIPQNTEGDEYLTHTITPTSATNKLRIDVVLSVESSASVESACALFQDSTAGALAGIIKYLGINESNEFCFTHFMDAGTTSATTFKVRAGPGSTGTLTINGEATNRRLGGVMASSLTVTEIKA